VTGEAEKILYTRNRIWSSRTTMQGLFFQLHVFLKKTMASVESMNKQRKERVNKPGKEQMGGRTDE